MISLSDSEGKASDNLLSRACEQCGNHMTLCLMIGACQETPRVSTSMPIEEFRTKGDVGCLNLNNWRNNECDSTLISDGILTQLLPMSNSTVQLECRYKLGLSTIPGSRDYNSAARSRTEEGVIYILYSSRWCTKA